MNSFEKHYQQKNFDIVYTDSDVAQWKMRDGLVHIVVLSYNDEWGMVMKEVPEAQAVFVQTKLIECPACHGTHTAPKGMGQGGCNRCNGEGVIRE